MRAKFECQAKRVLPSDKVESLRSFVANLDEFDEVSKLAKLLGNTRCQDSPDPTRAKDCSVL
jgi:hypothetical protein